MKGIIESSDLTSSPWVKRWFSLNLILALVVSLLTSTQLSIVPARAASSYYVDTSGSNSNPGSLSQPFARILPGFGI